MDEFNNKVINKLNEVEHYVINGYYRVALESIIEILVEMHIQLDKIDNYSSKWRELIPAAIEKGRIPRGIQSQGIVNQTSMEED